MLRIMTCANHILNNDTSNRVENHDINNHVDIITPAIHVQNNDTSKLFC
jgi:hypothetical protein